MRGLILCIVAVIAVSGCATTPIPSSQAQPAPKERVMAFQEKNDNKSATLVLTRDEGSLGGGCYYAFWINSILAARLNPGETSRFFLEPGEHVLRVGRDPQGLAMCALNSDNWTQRETILRANEIKFFRLSIDLNGRVDIQRSE